MTLAERIVELLKQNPGLSDRQITDKLFGVGKPQQPVNIACRDLEKKGVLIRRKVNGSPTENYLTGQELNISSSKPQKIEDGNEGNFSEDALKEVLKNWLIAQGWNVEIAWDAIMELTLMQQKKIRDGLLKLKDKAPVMLCA